MATFQKRGARWRAIVRKKGHPPQSRSFTTKARAKEWAKGVEDAYEAGELGSLSLSRITLGELLDTHMEHLERVSARGRKNKTADGNLRRSLGEEILLSEIGYKTLEDFCLSRLMVDKVKVATVKLDIMHLSAAITTGVVKEMIPRTFRETYSSWREGLRRAELIGSPEDRDRRPTVEELDALLVHTKHNKALRRIRYHDLIQFAVESSMRLNEICSLQWRDVDHQAGTVIIRLRKHPQKMTDQEVPLMGESQSILEAQPRDDDPRIFPYNAESVSNGFRRICRHLGIHDLHFHDLRHEGISRLFERGYQIQEVAMVSGHRDWKSLKRYVNLKPGELVRKDREG